MGADSNSIGCESRIIRLFIVSYLLLFIYGYSYFCNLIIEKI